MPQHQPLTQTETDLGRRLLENIIKIKIKKYKETLCRVLIMKYKYNTMDFLDFRMIDKDLSLLLLYGINNTSGLDQLERAYVLLKQIYDKMWLKLSKEQKDEYLKILNDRELLPFYKSFYKIHENIL